MHVCFKCKICGEEHVAPSDLGDRYTHSKNRGCNSSGFSIYCDTQWRLASYDVCELYPKDKD